MMRQKSVDATIQPVESDNPNGEFEVVLSTDDLDRDGERLFIDEWKQPLPKRIQIDGDHSRSIEKTVGSVVPRIENNKLVGKGPFAPTAYAQTIRQIVNDKDAEGHGLSISVTYAETKDKSGKPQRELLNAAFVAVPANPHAVILSAKSAEKDKDGNGLDASGNNPDPADMLQAIHDAACHLGAQCLNKIDADPGTADGANKELNGPTGTALDGLLQVVINNKSSDTESAGPPQESAEDAAAETAEKSAVPAAADTSADAVALRARSLAFLCKQTSLKE